MFIVERLRKEKFKILIEPVVKEEYKILTKKKYFFNWKTERNNEVYKLQIEGDREILGVVSLIDINDEERMEINLLSVSKANRGKDKKYERICGILIAFACREAIKRYGVNACVSLVPKTILKEHYIKLYGMLDAGRQVYLAGELILTMLKKYEL